MLKATTFHLLALFAEWNMEFATVLWYEVTTIDIEPLDDITYAHVCPIFFVYVCVLFMFVFVK